MNLKRTILLCAVVVICAKTSATHANPAHQALAPNSLFSDNAVLQRDRAVPVWGTAPEGTTVTVEFNGQSVTAKTINNQWQVQLAPMPANATPQTMTISGAGTRLIKNILVGDVWLASGQSNMERQLGLRTGQLPIDNWKSTAAAANNPLIREYATPHQVSLAPRDDANGEWSVCTPDNVVHFTAVGYFFIKEIYESQGIPLALIHSSWGGTPAESWTSFEKLQTLPSCAYALDTINKARDIGDDPVAIQQLKDQFYLKHDAGTSADKPWHTDMLDTSRWPEATVPGAFEEDFDGVKWYCSTFELTEVSPDEGGTLHLGRIDDYDTVWINGARVGASDSWDIKRRYSVPAGILRAGSNSISIRIYDKVGMGGWHSTSADDIRLDLPAKSLGLAGTWKSTTGFQFEGRSPYPESTALSQHTPTALYNAMIHPLLRFPIKGAIWYQGESNNGRADTYADLFAGMIADWRARWSQGDFPFLFVQIAPYQGMSPELREAQRQTLNTTANTAMAVITDFGNADDIHPSNKGPVGQRLALAARALAYGEDIEYSGPALEHTRAEGSELILEFSHTTGGLVAPGGQLIGFEIANDDGQFATANARIDGSTVVLRHDTIIAPTQARYGWGNVPDINLYNGSGLPASPFTTKNVD